MATKEQNELGHPCPCLGANGGGQSDKFEGSPTTSIAIGDGEMAQPATFGYNTKHGTHDPGLPARERKGGY